MNDSENIRLYFAHLAQHVAAIAHNPAATSETTGKRFFHMEDNELIRSKQYDFLNFTLLLEEHEGGLNEARHENVTAKDLVAFMVVKHCELNNVAVRHATLKDAFEVGMDVVRLINQHVRNCGPGRLHPPPVGVSAPLAMPLNNVRWHPVGPLYREAWGYRFLLDMYTLNSVNMAANPARYV